ncbi:MAG: glycosyltransferase family 4 protein [Alphaproteobacteria bacterium]|nr:glycosyltransferase family 4 protein [Alphaproteobacteria bacterium]
MKIAYYTDCDLNNNDGPAVNEQEFLLQLKKFSDNFIFVTISKNKTFCVNHDIKNVYFFDEFKFSSVVQKFRYLKLARILSKENFDILVCRFIGIPLIPFFLMLLDKNKKMAIKTAGLWYADDIKSNNFFDWIYKKFRDVIYHYLYQKAVVVDTALPYAKEHITKEFGIDARKIFMVENGINTDKFSLNNNFVLKEVENFWPILGFMGSFPSSRGCMQIFEVSKRLIKTYPNLGVIILGQDDHINSIVSNLVEIGVKVFFPGKVPYSTIEQYVTAMTIGFSFYEDSVGIHGNASQKVRQYLSCGKPVFSIHHNHDFLVENDLGSIFDSNNYDLMSKEALMWIQRIEEDPSEIANRLRNYAIEHFSVHATFHQRLDIYKKILGQS